MQPFPSTKTLRKFSSVHAQIHKHFYQERHLVSRDVFDAHFPGCRMISYVHKNEVFCTR